VQSLLDVNQSDHVIALFVVMIGCPPSKNTTVTWYRTTRKVITK